jgi:hypothetical protein
MWFGLAAVKSSVLTSKVLQGEIKGVSWQKIAYLLFLLMIDRY